jgi:hypothetical protein
MRAVVLLLCACGSSSAPPSSDLGDDAAVPIVDGGGSDGGGANDLAPSGPCPAEMALVAIGDGGVCVDRWEAYVVELADGGEVAHSPYVVIGGLAVRAKSAGGVVPQGYISQVEATAACANAGKRLCAKSEFAAACTGNVAGYVYPYGPTKTTGWCNQDKGSSMPLFFGNNPANWTYAEFNDPRLNQWDGGLAPTASYPHCVSAYGIFDCVGNLHEWGSDPADANGHGRFRGGFYGDATINGMGCTYVTSAHGLTYHDYSTGFRCCADPR